MKTVLKFAFGLVTFAGVMLILGTAGADCDGKCLENSLPIGQILLQFGIGLAGVAAGALGLTALAD